MNILSWNIIGLNDPNKVVGVKRLLRLHSVSIVGLLETKVKYHKVTALQKKFGSKWLWQCNYNHSTRGRIWLGWVDDLVNVTVLHVHEQFIHCFVTDKQMKNPIYLTVVYGLHTVETRRALWRDLLSLVVTTSPWLLLGDFNSVLASSDRINGAPISQYEIQDFEDFLLNADVTEVQSSGFHFSWSNKGHGSARIASRIDRCLANQAWSQMFSHVMAKYLAPSVSDHSPVLVELLAAPSGGGRPFRFLNLLADHEQFDPIVTECWSRHVPGTGLQCTPLGRG